MDVSIIIVNWNTAALLSDCLASVFANATDMAVEVIVVDNASTDHSVENVKTRFPQAVLIENPSNVGFAAANNQAMKIARGNMFLLLNSDTVILGSVIQDSVQYLRDHPQVGAMGCRVLNADRSLQMTSGGFPTLTRMFFQLTGLSRLKWPAVFDSYQLRHWTRDTVREIEVITGCFLMVRREVVSQVGLFDENFFFFGEETDWCRRMIQGGWKLHFAPVGEIIHYDGGSANRLRSERDLMLSSASVKLHLKHSGLAGGIAAWILVVAFNVSRAGFWTVRAAIDSRQSSRDRRDHFIAIVRSIGRIWPRGMTLQFRTGETMQDTGTRK